MILVRAQDGTYYKKLNPKLKMYNIKNEYDEKF